MLKEIKSLLAAGKNEGCDSFFISGFENIYYFSGFKTLGAEERAAFLFIAEDAVYLMSDSRYLNDETVKGLAPGISGVIIGGDNKLEQALAGLATRRHVKTMGIEAADLRLAEYLQIKKAVGCQLRSADSLIDRQREIKNRQELRLIKTACGLVDRCLEETVPLIRAGQTEKEIAAMLENWLRVNGDGPAFSPIVAIDADSSLPHYDSRRGIRQVGCGSLILIDCGAEYRGYRSDTTRVFFYGSVTPKQRRMYNDLLDAQEKTIRFLHGNKSLPLAEADSYCRKMIAASNYPPFLHSLGHGIGLQTHERPRLSFKSGDTLQPGQVFTVEPGIYYPGLYGMRIEDTVTVGKKGEIEVLTKYPKTIKILNNVE